MKYKTWESEKCSYSSIQQRTKKCVVIRWIIIFSFSSTLVTSLVVILFFFSLIDDPLSKRNRRLLFTFLQNTFFSLLYRQERVLFWLSHVALRRWGRKVRYESYDTDSKYYYKKQRFLSVTQRIFRSYRVFYSGTVLVVVSSFVFIYVRVISNHSLTESFRRYSG
jgi:hypothetical protein